MGSLTGLFWSLKRDPLGSSTDTLLVMSFISLLIVTFPFRECKSYLTCIETGLIMLLPLSCVAVVKQDCICTVKTINFKVHYVIKTKVCRVR